MKRRKQFDKRQVIRMIIGKNQTMTESSDTGMAASFVVSDDSWWHRKRGALIAAEREENACGGKEEKPKVTKRSEK